MRPLGAGLAPSLLSDTRPKAHRNPSGSSVNGELFGNSVRHSGTGAPGETVTVAVKAGMAWSVSRLPTGADLFSSDQPELALAMFLLEILLPDFAACDRPDRNSPRKSKKADDFPARKPGEPSITNVTRYICFHLLEPRMIAQRKVIDRPGGTGVLPGLKRRCTCRFGWCTGAGSRVSRSRTVQSCRSANIMGKCAYARAFAQFLCLRGHG